jgi:limonene-1,2-epoxide hydrolase
MAFCVNCGKPLSEGQRFCPSCGTAVGQAAATQGAPPPAAQPSQPPAVEPSVPPQPPYAAPAPPPPPPPPSGYGYGPQGPAQYGPPGYAPPGPRSRKAIWISLAAGVLVIAIACVLVFVVFWGNISGGSGAASTPEKTVQKLLDAMEAKDVDAMVALMDQKALEDSLGGMSMDMVKGMLRGAMLDFDSVKFSGVTMSAKSTSDTTSTVTITQGTVTIKQNGQETSEDVSEANDAVTFDLTKIDGKWYLNPSSLSNLGGGLGDSSSYTTTTLGVVPTTEASADDTAGVTSTSGGESISAKGSPTPEAAVLAFLDAMQKEDMMGVLLLMDPNTVEQSLGMSLDEAAMFFGSDLFDFESISFSGIELSTEQTGPGTATVTITAGSATVTDSDGQVSTEDVRDAGEPVEFPVIQEDGLWYLDPTSLFGGD